MRRVSLAQRGGKSLDPLLEQGLAPLCSCRDYSLQMSTETRLLDLFLLLPFRKANRRLMVNASLEPT